MLTGLIFTMTYIVMCTANKVLPMFFDAPLLAEENYLLNGWFGLEQGIGPQGIGTIGMALNFLVTILVSKFTADPPEHVIELIENVRTPENSGAAQDH